jgi:N-acetylglucosamine kinase-like BadF-type ATPase
MTGELFIGLESVGRQSMYGVACDAEGTILGACSQPGGVSFYTTPTEEILPQFRLLLGHLRDVIGDKFPSVNGSWSNAQKVNVAIGLTGINSSFDAQQADYIFRRIDEINNANLCLIGDIEAAFVGSTRAVDGSAIFVSAGSVIATFKDGYVTKLGGWGPAFTDDGSAYQIGRDALRLIAEWTDHKKISTQHFTYTDAAMTKLWNSIDNWMRYPATFSEFKDNGRANGWANTAAEWRRIRRLFLLTNQEKDLPIALVSFAYSVLRESVPAWWNFVASLSIPLIKQIEDEHEQSTIDNPVADILNAFTNAICNRLKTTERYVREKTPSTPCVLCGGLLNHQTYLAKKVKEKLAVTIGANYNFIHMKDGSTLRPVVGALLLALGGSTMNQLRLPSQEIIQNICDQLSVENSKWKGCLSNG